MVKMNSLLESITKVDDSQLTELMFAFSDRHKQLHPDWELVFFPLPTDPDLREKHITDHLPFLRCALRLDSEK